MLHKEVDLYFIFLQRTVLTEDQHLTAFFPCLHNHTLDKTVQSMILYDITNIFSAEMVFCYQNCSDLGVVHKLRLQDQVGRWSKNVTVHSIEIVNTGG